LGFALTVEQKLKLHACSLKRAATKTIPHWRIKNLRRRLFVVIK
jgi:hypothetical protein